MAAASDTPPMIVNPGYLSSRRTPNFQSSHDSPVHLVMRIAASVPPGARR
jgi:hypothetical protein